MKISLQLINTISVFGFFFSAVKCNDDYAVLKLLADMGTNFDCASKVGFWHIWNFYEGVKLTNFLF